LKRFSFGKNWENYSELVDFERIHKAKIHLQIRFRLKNFEGNFIDIGSGSGVFSAAASQLGAKVYAFDYDEASVKTTKKILSIHGVATNVVSCEIGDVLSDEFTNKVANFEYIYSWGVLHHTGDMWKALDAVAQNAKSNSRFVVSIYNDLGRETDLWAKLKEIYVNHLISRPFIVAYAWYRFWSKQQLKNLILGQDPFKSWREYSIDSRGMSAWYDLIDWAGGFPYERAKIEKVVNFMEERGWQTLEVWPNEGIGCNEFLFQKI
jgi:2-polyprenyl-6-hydroxyphenyl methylase/3-demethylubiquinone-9 3-methyltransferase